ncbi:erythropoietin receptor-like [Dendropsophus ebraccatus]|uniref:erythropoietin receptor-like n=1 Tax=Dendropsophus ebraccatus TaxID=150705 RepID=UPI003831BE2D
MKLENPDCYSNYAHRISCIWNKGSHPGNGPFHLTLIDTYDDETFGCNLVSSTNDDNYQCNITGLDFTEIDEYKIMVEDFATIERFKPHCNIKLDPPSDLSYNCTDTVCNVTWGGNSEFGGNTRIQYELQLKKEASGQEMIKNTVHDKYMEFMLSELDEGANYVRLRCRTENQHDYRSRWSEWSAELKIAVMKEGQKEDIIHIITIITLLTLTLILLFLALSFNLSSRINVTFLKKIPTAANFFHPLYHIHDGNFQDWTKYPNKCKEDRNGGRKHGFPQDTDLYNTTVLYFQKEAVTPVKLESPLSKEDISMSHDTHKSMSATDPLVEKETSLNGIYPTFFGSFPGFTNDIMNDKDVVCSLDCSTDYFSYEGNYMANSKEITE